MARCKANGREDVKQTVVFQFRQGSRGVQVVFEYDLVHAEAGADAVFFKDVLFFRFTEADNVVDKFAAFAEQGFL